MPRSRRPAPGRGRVRGGRRRGRRRGSHGHDGSNGREASSWWSWSTWSCSSSCSRRPRPSPRSWRPCGPPRRSSRPRRRRSANAVEHEQTVQQSVFRRDLSQTPRKPFHCPDLLPILRGKITLPRGLPRLFVFHVRGADQRAFPGPRLSTASHRIHPAVECDFLDAARFAAVCGSSLHSPCCSCGQENGAGACERARNWPGARTGDTVSSTGEVIEQARVTEAVLAPSARSSEGPSRMATAGPSSSASTWTATGARSTAGRWRPGCWPWPGPPPRSIPRGRCTSRSSGPFRAARRGRRPQVRHAGRTVATVQVDLFDERDKLAVVALVTLVTPSAVAADHHDTTAHATSRSSRCRSTPDAWAAPVTDRLDMRGTRVLGRQHAAEHRRDACHRAEHDGPVGTPRHHRSRSRVPRRPMPRSAARSTAGLRLRRRRRPERRPDVAVHHRAGDRRISGIATMLSMQHGTATVAIDVRSRRPAARPRPRHLTPAGAPMNQDQITQTVLGRGAGLPRRADRGWRWLVVRRSASISRATGARCTAARSPREPWLSLAPPTPDRSPRSLHLQMVRSVPRGVAFATASVRHLGRTVATVEVEMFDERRKLAVLGLVTMITPTAVAAEHHDTSTTPFRVGAKTFPPRMKRSSPRSRSRCRCRGWSTARRCCCRWRTSAPASTERWLAGLPDHPPVEQPRAHRSGVCVPRRRRSRRRSGAGDVHPARRLWDRTRTFRCASRPRPRRA